MGATAFSGLNEYECGQWSHGLIVCRLGKGVNMASSDDNCLSSSLRGP
jgi:hypothetical protein